MLGLGLDMSYLINSYIFAGLPVGNLVFYLRGDYTPYDDTGNHTPTKTAGLAYGTGIYSGDDSQAFVFNDTLGSGVNKVNIDDAADLSFGDGTTDSPFSFTFPLLITENPIASGHRIIAKSSTTVSTASREYNIALAGGGDVGKIQVFFYDQSTGGLIGVLGSTVLSPNTAYFIAVTYDGSSAYTGIKIYIDGVEETSYTDISSGSYTAMENLTAPITIGKRAHDGGQNLRGKIEGIGLWNYEMPISDVVKAYAIHSDGKEIQYLPTPQNVAPRQFRYNGNSPNYEWVSGDQYRDPSSIIEFNGSFYFYASKYDEGLFAGDYSEEIAVFKSSTYNGTYTYEGVVLNIAGSGLDDRCIFTPEVIVVSGTIYMFYTGAGTTNSERWNLFCASSTDPEGTFTRVQTDPILYNSTDGSGDTEEDYRVDAATPCILPDGTIRLYYKMVSGDAGGGVTARAFGYAAVDTFPTSWTKATADNPFFDSTDTPNGSNPEGPGVFYQNGKFHMVYVTADVDTGIYFAESADGINSWSDIYEIEETDLPTTSTALHGAGFYFKNGNLNAIIFHGGPEGNFNDVRRIEMLTYD